jgi:stage II sporulation protein D
VRVLLGGRGGVTRFTGATAAGGRALRPDTTYGAKARSDGRVDLLSPTGRRLRIAPRAAHHGLRAHRPRGPRRLPRRDRAPPGRRRLDAINSVGLDDYVRGVVSKESPPRGPAEALEAQAVAARTYAVTTAKGVSPAWEHYADTRSQVYAGVGAETPSTDARRRGHARAGRHLPGPPRRDYFFSTSGGKTADVENLTLGGAASRAQGVGGSLRRVSPRHAWKPATITFAKHAQAQALRGLSRGRFEGIEACAAGACARAQWPPKSSLGRAHARRDPARSCASGSASSITWAFFTAITRPAPRSRRGPRSRRRRRKSSSIRTAAPRCGAAGRAAARPPAWGPRIVAGRPAYEVVVSAGLGSGWVGRRRRPLRAGGRFRWKSLLPDLPRTFRLGCRAAVRGQR